MNIVDDLQYLKETKNLIKQSIIDKGVEVPVETPFRQYADKIGEISSGEITPADIDMVGFVGYRGDGIFSKFSDGKESGGYFTNVWNTTREPVIVNIKFRWYEYISGEQWIFDLSGGFQLKMYGYGSNYLRSYSWLDNSEHLIIYPTQNVWYYASMKVIPKEDYSTVEYYISTDNFNTDPSNKKVSFDVNFHDYAGTIGVEGWVFNGSLKGIEVDMKKSCVTDYDGNIIKKFFPI